MKNAYRIGYNRYVTDEQFAQNLNFVKQNLALIDEIVLFVEYSHHGYWAPDQQAKISKIIKARMDEYRRAGVRSVGINVLCTVGHMDESFDFLAKPPMQTVVGDDGYISKSCLCINAPEFNDYITKRYITLAQSNPDFIWIDDDFRIIWHAASNPCFCPHCIKKFNLQYNRAHTFETLSGAIKKREPVTLAEFDEFRINGYTKLATVIKNAIYSVNPDIKIGFMSGPFNAKTEWIEAFDTKMARPGGGFYNDDTPKDALKKAYSVGVQLQSFNSKITDRQYEFENFPYQRLAKSQTATNLEIAAALMSGCNGILYNAMFSYDNPQLMQTIQDNNALYNQITKNNADSRNIGAYLSSAELYPMSEIGLPLATSMQSAGVAVISGAEFIQKQTDGQLTELLGKNVIMDGDAFAEIEKRGFARFCGVTLDKTFTNGTNERFTDHKINYPYAGYKRDIFANFWYGEKPTYSFKVVNNNTQVLSNLESVNHDHLGIATTLFKNELGGNICVNGYFFPAFFKSEEKRRQVLNIFDALTNNTFAVRIDKCHNFGTIASYSESNNSLQVLAANQSLDATGDFDIEIRLPVKKLYVLNAKGEKSQIEFTNVAGGIKAKLDNIQPFCYKIILAKL